MNASSFDILEDIHPLGHRSANVHRQAQKVQVNFGLA